MISLFTLIMLAQADGGHDLAVDDAGTYTAQVYSTCPGAPPVQVLDGGWKLLPPERAERIACLMAVCESERDRRAKEMAATPPQPSWLVYVGTAASSFAAGFTLAKLFGK